MDRTRNWQLDYWPRFGCDHRHVHPRNYRPTRNFRIHHRSGTAAGDGIVVCVAYDGIRVRTLLRGDGDDGVGFCTVFRSY